MAKCGLRKCLNGPTFIPAGAICGEPLQSLLPDAASASIGGKNRAETCPEPIE